MTKKRKKRTPSEAFQFLVAQCNKKDLRYLLGLAAGRSAVSVYAEKSDQLAQCCHLQANRVFLDAVFRSNAELDSFEPLRIQDLPKLINSSLIACDDPSAINKLNRANRTERSRLELTRFLAQIGQVQIAPLSDGLEVDMARTLCLLREVPLRYQREIEGRVTGSEALLKIVPKDLLGICLLEVTEVFLALLKQYDTLWERCSKLRPPNPSIRSLSLVDLHKLALRGFWTFSWQSLPRRSPLRDIAKRFLKVVSRTPEQARQLYQMPNSPFSGEYPAYRLNASSRHPILSMGEGRYLIPDLHIFRTSFPDLVNFTLLEAYRQRGLGGLYNQVRGASLEIYIEQLVASKLPTCIFIPERAYRTSMGEKKSPDLCIIDTENSSLVAIEVKARALTPKTAVVASDSALDANYEPSLKALQLLPQKIEDMRTAPEFSDYHGVLKAIQTDQCILVSVAASTLFLQDSLEAQRAELDDQHPLSGMKNTFCFIDLSTFERAVEIAAFNRIPLAVLLRQHHEGALKSDFNATAARNFRGRALPETDKRFVFQFLEM